MSQPPYPPHPPADDPQAPRTAQIPVQPTGEQPVAQQHSRPVQQQFSQPVHPQPVGPPPGQPTGPQEYRLPTGYDPAYPAAPTGPMDWVPGFPDDRPSAPVGPSGQHDTGRAPQVGVRGRGTADRARITATVLGVLGLVVLQLGLALSSGPTSLWSAVPTWSAFATVAALVALVPYVPGGGLSRRQAWRVGAAGVGGLAVFWVLVALPLVASDQGFLLTAALGLAAGGLWLTPGRTAAP
ncbi:MAG: hypothetical protein JWQ53_1885 [Klenkia sp.]|nr:hypothetical protein [Klenkia sp.]